LNPNSLTGADNGTIQHVSPERLSPHIAKVIMYPDSSHAAFYQHRKAFLGHVKIFLSDGDSVVPDQDSIKSSVA
jgi:hypothetical protein